MGTNDLWHEELGLEEGAILIDLGACPWCGDFRVEVASNGRAAGRKPPDMCCLHGTLAGIARIKAGMAVTKSAGDRAELEAQLRAAIRHLASLRAGGDELKAAVSEVRDRYALKVDWASVLAAMRRAT